MSTASTKPATACSRAAPVSRPTAPSGTPGSFAVNARASTVPKTAAPSALPRVWKNRTPVVATPSWCAGAARWTTEIRCPISWPSPAPSSSSSARTSHSDVPGPLSPSSSSAAAEQRAPEASTARTDTPRASSRLTTRPIAVIPTAIGIR